MLVNNITILEEKLKDYLKKLLLKYEDYSYIIYEVSSYLEKIEEKDRLNITISIIKDKDFDKVLNSFVKDNKLNIKSFPRKYLTNNVTELFLVYCSENNIIYDNLEEDFFSDDLFSIYMKDITKYPLLTEEEQDELLVRIKNGDEEAKKTFIECNLRLTIAILKLYFSCINNNGVVNHMDLVQEGNMGLIKAVELFDISLGYRFSTYASWAIRHNIIRYIDNTKRTIRIPINVKKECKEVNKAEEELYQKLGKSPTTKEISEYINVPLDKVLTLLNINQDIASLDSFVGDEGTSTLKEFIVDENVSVEKTALNNITRDKLVDIIENMNITRRDKDIIYLRYGFIDGMEHSLQDVGNHFNVTRERIRQLEGNVLEKMRNSRKIKKLRDKR